jgi:hypothetical protein
MRPSENLFSKFSDGLTPLGASFNFWQIYLIFAMVSVCLAV